MTVQHLSSQQIFIGKTEIPSITSYDDVIKNRDPQQLPRFHQPGCDGSIFSTWLTIAAGVVVPTDD